MLSKNLIKKIPLINSIDNYFYKLTSNNWIIYNSESYSFSEILPSEEIIITINPITINN